jgi:hypothetical protein
VPQAAAHAAACEVGINLVAHKEVTAFRSKAALAMQPYESADWYEHTHALFMQAVVVHMSSEAASSPVPSPMVCSPSPEAGASTVPPPPAESLAVVIDSEAAAASVVLVCVVLHLSVPLLTDSVHFFRSLCLLSLQDPSTLAHLTATMLGKGMLRGSR